MSLTDRQQKLLFSIIKEFIETAEAVGSISLQNKYKFDLSPATIRNEMSDLVGEGFLFQKHNSGGRIPTTKGWRFFVEKLFEKELVEIDEQTRSAIIGNLFKVKDDSVFLIRQAIHFLSNISENASIALLDGNIYYSGLSEMVKIPEFKESDSLQRILKILEDYYTLSEILNKTSADNDLNILIGEETGHDYFKDYSVIFSEVRLNGNKKGYIAVIGPNRMKYDQVIAAMQFIMESIRNLLTD
jgi:transcriptional regulator of heat shock response